MNDTLILCYHSVAPGWDDSVAVTPQRFAAQMGFLDRLGYRGVRFTEAATSPAGGARRVAVTFDDAFRSVLEHAFPILERRGWPGTVFTATDYANGERLIDWPRLDVWLGTEQEHQLKPMRWPELSALQEAGWEVGSHTCSHPHLTAIDLDQVEHELAESRRLCQEHLGSCRSIAYPYGDVDERVIAVARRVGYEAAAGLPAIWHDVRPLEWPRIGIYHVDHIMRFATKVVPLTRRLRVLRASPAAETAS